MRETPVSIDLNWRGRVTPIGKAWTIFGGTTTQQKQTCWVSPVCMDAVGETLESWVMADNNISDIDWSSGVIQDVVGQMPRLKRLDVRNNQMRGSALVIRDLTWGSSLSSFVAKGGKLLLHENPLRVKLLLDALLKLGKELDRANHNEKVIEGWLTTLFPDVAEVKDASANTMMLQRGSVWVLPPVVHLNLGELDLQGGTDPSEFVSFDLYAETLTKLDVRHAPCAGSWAESKWLHQLRHLTHLTLAEMHPAHTSDCTLPTRLFTGLNKLAELTINVSSSTTPVKVSQGTFQGLSNVTTLYVRCFIYRY